MASKVALSTLGRFRSPTGEIGVVNYAYPVGDVRRYGVSPDGTTNWENVNNSVTGTGAMGVILANSLIDGIEIYWPSGYYACGINWSSAYSGSKMFFEPGAVFGGVIHLISAASPTTGDTPLTNVRLRGLVTTNDRFGTIMCRDSFIERVRVGSDTTKHSASPGTKSRGAHLYFGCDNISIGEIVVEDCGSDSTSDAAVSMDGNTANPINFKIGRIWVKDSEVHGVYITGGGHKIGEIQVDAYGSGTYGGTGLQDSDGLAQSQALNGVWLNKFWNCDIGTIRVNQGSGSRANAKYPVLIDETGLAATLESNRIGKIVAATVSTTTHNYGVALVDKDYPTVNPFNIEIGSIEVNCGTSTTFDSGYYPVGLYNPGGAGTIHGRSEIGMIRLIGIAANDGFFSDTKHDIFGRRLSCQSHTGRLCNITGGGYLDYIYGLQTGGSPAKSVCILANTLHKFGFGRIEIDSSATVTAQALVISNTIPLQGGHVVVSNFRSASGTVQFNGSTGRTSIVDMYAKGDAVGGTVSSIGIRFSGATDVHITRARADRFVTGFNESGTNTGCIIGELAHKDNGTASSLSTVTARNTTAL